MGGKPSKGTSKDNRIKGNVPPKKKGFKPFPKKGAK